MSKLKTIKVDVEQLKRNVLYYPRPPKNNEGENESIWIDTSTKKVYFKNKNIWQEITQDGALPDVIDCGEY